LKIARELNLADALLTPFALDQQDEMPTTCRCSVDRCGKITSTANGEDEALAHASAHHADVENADVTLSCCVHCSILFITEIEAQRHLQQSATLQSALSSTGLKVTLPPSKAMLGADKFTTMFETLEVVYREQGAIDAVYLLRINNESSFDALGLITVLPATDHRD
jgi:hypothetical protein